MNMDQLTFFAGEHPVRISVSQDLERDWMARAVHSQLNLLDWLNGCAPVGWFGRTSPAFCHVTEDGRLESSCESWGTSGMGSHTEFLTLSTLEFHSAADASSLSDILEIGDVPRRFFLSGKTTDLSSQDFSLDSRRRIYAQMAAMFEDQRAVDLVTLTAELKGTDVTYLSGLIDHALP